MQIGRKIYYDKVTGDIIVNTGDRRGSSLVITTVEEDFAAFKALADRIPDTVGWIQLEYGQYAQDFLECSSVQVNPSTLELEFSYPNPGEPEETPVYQKPLSVEVEELKIENTDLKGRVSDMELAFADLITGGGV